MFSISRVESIIINIIYDEPILLFNEDSDYPIVKMK